MINTHVSNNAAWCAAMCRAHGIATSEDGRVWRSPVRTPLYYPDAVTLVPGLSAAAVLDGVDAGPGASVKDSFADLDLSGHGFSVLFEASWIRREPGPSAAAEWSLVDTDGGLAAWEEGWGGASGLFVPALLAEPEVRIVRTPGGGAVLNRTGDVVGVSNVHGDAWPGAIAAARELFGELPLVGYESGDDVAPALAAGFAVAGPLRVWLRA
ncbi:hypothetical protein Afil01_45290 [Actinorhabdospora filicis]|uniref:Uncharacterized protein n=1 Tax=Actinorhabdospora filicis TaxID=1785913 RepID=A0A9W6SPH3_9ACTN|nr:hypothetical protein [Actinorhabdospora filicis]GLZ79722.1 hypothetical protein Afil01_45290 [Actinorhabdospora filicis]